MPINERELNDIRRRLYAMFMDTIETFEAINKNAETMYGGRADELRGAIDECLDDLVRNPSAAGRTHPETLVFKATKEDLQRHGFYGAQLSVKERQVNRANHTLRERLAEGVRNLWKRPFYKWVDIINNFLGSFGPVTGIGEALKELKDCLRDELPEDDSD